MSSVRFMADGKDERDEHALREVQDFEGDGSIINEWYTNTEYMQRRHGFLGKYPDYKDAPKLAQSTRWDADMVFSLESTAKLSVQEIRRRELEYEILPLLPYPTTANTETIDNFSAYPTEEWHPGVEIPVIPVTSPFATLAAPVLTETESPPPTQTSIDQLQPLSPNNYFAHPASATMARLAAARLVSNAPRQMSQSQTFRDQGQQLRPVYPQQTGYANYQLHSNFNPMNLATTNHLLTPLATSAMASVGTARPAYPPMGASKMPDPAYVLKVVDDLSRYGSLGPSDKPAERSQRWTGASSLAGRPVEGTVKSPANAKKRAAPDDDDDEITAADVPRPDSARPDSSVADQQQTDGGSDTEDQRPAVKKPKLILKASPPKKTSAASQTKSSSSSRQKKKTPATTGSPVKRSVKATGKQRQRTTTNDDTASVTSTSTTAPSSTTAANTLLDRIARGEILPKSKPLATAASAHRHTLLLAAHARKTHHPDFPPEFYDRANFSKDDLAKQNVVRCLCGDTKDDKNPLRDRDWVGCDNEKCGVWQHVDCIGEAVPKDLDRDDYLCHMCDPFRHRRRLQEVRREANGLN
ncbi:hypothetical protein M409DRAFT_19646 [Zasmidium cellare ATCC 36951]|uniref:Zinc finger PHD-type domain-containing protein n=1 Tax=Zasmidium cellare ATCC 36951 TaxID=1080233 RepID=A0A6A6CTJ1_ZASCE|nr:uncharacterized protein M409DRAFT_19646 [Zasmidium cellare ATCC 36951]KAF2170033.1 hypothetical protein M409DRAFT_19646 [Zasmidium cellare ATCC 36951]